MGWFGSSSSSDSGDTSMSTATSGLDLSSSSSSSSDLYASKKRSSYDLSSSDFSNDAGGSIGLAEGEDFQAKIAIEQKKMQLTAQMHKLNEICWDVCIDSIGPKLYGKQEACLQNCAGRFIDTTLLVTNRFAQLAQKMQGGMR